MVPRSRAISQDRAVYVDDQFIANANTNLPRIDIVEAFPNYPGIHTSRPGFQIGFLASRFTNGPHTRRVQVFYSDGHDHRARTAHDQHRQLAQPVAVRQRRHPRPRRHLQRLGILPGLRLGARHRRRRRKVEVLIDNGVMQNAMYGDPRPDVGQHVRRLAGCALQRLHRQRRHDAHPGRRPHARRPRHRPHRPVALDRPPHGADLQRAREPQAVRLHR